MPRQMTKATIVAALADKVGTSKKTATDFVEALAAMAYKEARTGFPIPGIGKLVVRKREARRGHNPKTGQPMNIPARRYLKVVISKTATDAVLSRK
jgi:DNA-binding protein HU-beta